MMKNGKAFLPSIFLAVLLAQNGIGGIITPLYVGNTSPILDEFKRPIRGTWGQNDASLIEIRVATDGIIRPPQPNGEAHPKNPLLRSSFAGKNACGANSGLFCEIFVYRIETTNLIFARAYNSPSASNATFYSDTPLYGNIATHQSSLVMTFGDAKPIDSNDDDLDGINNSWETVLGIDDRLTPDYDGDGATDLEEMLAGTAPDDPSSIFKITGVWFHNDSVEVSWSSIPGKTYIVQKTTSLKNEFMDVGTQIKANSFEQTETATGTNINGFYRVIIPK